MEQSQGPKTPLQIRLDHAELAALDAYIPRSRGQAEPHDFCSGREPGYCLSPYSAMMLPRKLP